MTCRRSGRRPVRLGAGRGCPGGHQEGAGGLSPQPVSGDEIGSGGNDERLQDGLQLLQFSLEPEDSAGEEPQRERGRPRWHRMWGGMP